MNRIFIETRSNRLYRGVELEQDYDQRVICQAGGGHVVITTNPYDPAYLKYWEQIGFELPRFITAGPFDPKCTQSQLIMNNKQVQRDLHALVDDGPARLEFFFIEETEAELARVLEIEPYCNFDISFHLAGKIAFKQLCDKLSLPTLAWNALDDSDRWLEEGTKLLDSGVPVLFKADDGTGGVECGGMFKADTLDGLRDAVASVSRSGGRFLMEPYLNNKAHEGCLHWEITEDGTSRIIGFFEMIEDNCSYAGAFYPSDIPDATMTLMISQLEDKLAPWLVEHGGRGYYTCDILVDDQGTPYWTDFNPRKGATLYIWDMVRRVSDTHFDGGNINFWYEHYLRIPDTFGKTPRFADIAEKIRPLLMPDTPPFAVITNPGLIRHGFLDLTGIAATSRQDARDVVREIKSVLGLHAYGAGD